LAKESSDKVHREFSRSLVLPTPASDRDACFIETSHPAMFRLLGWEAPENLQRYKGKGLVEWLGHVPNLLVLLEVRQNINWDSRTDRHL